MASKTVSRLRSRLRRLNIGAPLDFDVELPILVGGPSGGKVRTPRRSRIDVIEPSRSESETELR